MVGLFIMKKQSITLGQIEEEMDRSEEDKSKSIRSGWIRSTLAKKRREEKEVP